MKIKIHDTTYIFLLLSFLSGYFEYIYLLLIIIFIHEFGHFIFGLLVNFKLSCIIIYPFGGITYYDEELNVSIFKEFISLVGGILFQLLFVFFIKYMYSLGYVTEHVYSIIIKLNYLLISFNFMAVIPLDGGKLLNNILDYFISYKKSFLICIIISIIFSVIFLIVNFSILGIIVFIFLIRNIYNEIKNYNLKYNRFLLERYIKKHRFRRTRIIKDENNFYRDCYHIINDSFEIDYLRNKYD